MTDIDKKISDTSGVVITNVLNTTFSEVQNKIPDTSSLVTTTVLNTKVSELENKVRDYSKYITQGFSKLTAENFAASLTQANLVSKTDFDNKLISCNRKITWNKTKYLEVIKNLDSLATKDYNFFLGKIYFISDDGSQNTFVYQSTLHTLQLKKTKVPVIFCVGNEKEHIAVKLSRYILLSHIA